MLRLTEATQNHKHQQICQATKLNAGRDLYSEHITSRSQCSNLIELDIIKLTQH